MGVVVPLRGRDEGRARRVADEVARFVAVVLEHEVHVSLAPRAVAYRACELGQDPGPRVVGDRVHRVEAQAVEVILLEPVEGVVDEEIPHGARPGAAEVDRGAPWGPMGRVEELRRVDVQVVALGSEVVVDDVEQHHQPARVRRGDERLQRLRRPVD
jgi:hypothetical protein